MQRILFSIILMILLSFALQANPKNTLAQKPIKQKQAIAINTLLLY